MLQCTAEDCSQLSCMASCKTFFVNSHTLSEDLLKLYAFHFIYFISFYQNDTSLSQHLKETDQFWTYITCWQWEEILTERPTWLCRNCYTVINRQCLMTLMSCHLNTFWSYALGCESWESCSHDDTASLWVKLSSLYSVLVKLKYFDGRKCSLLSPDLPP